MAKPGPKPGTPSPLRGRKRSPMSEEGKKNCQGARLKYIEEHPECMSGKNHPQWKGGIGNYQTLIGKLNMMYHGINRRCNNPDYPQYRDYGGRGIRNMFVSFEDFFNYIVNELGITERSQMDGLCMDRIDNDGNYEPGNLRFIPHSESQYNRRNRVKP